MRYIWKRCFAALLAVVMVFALLPGLARAADQPFENAGGTGEEGDPYQIATKEQFEAFRGYINNDSGHGDGQYFKLTTNIDLEGSELNQWTPIGDSDCQFQGTFDGGEHTISGLYINNNNSDQNQGLFGFIGNSGIVKNLTVEGSVTGGSNVGGIAGNSSGTLDNCHNRSVSIIGGSYVGGVVGIAHAKVSNCSNTSTVNGTEYIGGVAGSITNYGTGGSIINCYNTGDVMGTSNYVGGVVGSLWNNRIVKNCYNTGVISGTSYTGGIVGLSDKSEGTVEYCYNYGSVTADSKCGAIVGYGSCTNCYYLTGTADKGVGDGDDSGVTNRDDYYFRALASYLDSDVWEDDLFLGRPVLKDNREPSPISGRGTESEPYLIPDKETLEVFQNYVNAYNNCDGMYFKVTANIDLENENWVPIARYSEFMGTFDGGGYTISGLNINMTDSWIGFFGKVGIDGTVKNLTVAGSVSCWSYGAAIVGDNDGTVENCHNNCNIHTITNHSYYGGVVGKNYGTGVVKNCYNTGNISGDGRYSGGIVGDNVGTVKNCYNTGNVSGNRGADGIVGSNGIDYSSRNVGTVENCYNSGNVTSSDAGGIVGSLSYGTIRNCYYLTGTADKGIGSGNGDGTTPKTEAEFNSGEVAWLLQDDQPSQVWGQTVSGDADDYPVLTADGNKKVYQITGKVAGQDDIVWYSNSTATLPADPVKSGFAFVGWSTTAEGTEANFEQGTTISADMTVYAVFTQLRPGEGSVKMENYTCGDKSVEPVAESETNTGEVTITYKKKGADDATYTSDKPTTAGEYTVRAVFAAANGYDEVTATADFRITHKVPSSVNGEVKCGCESELRLEAGPLTEVPPALKTTYSNVETLTRTLAEQVDTGANYAVYDVKIEVKKDGEGWQDAPEDSIPDSVTVTLPYPAGTNSGYTFKVVHMFASGDNAGQTETPPVTKGADGLTVTLSGLSPVCVGWTAPSSGFPGFYPASFSVAVPSDCEGGSVTADSASTIQGSKVTLTVKPDEGYHFGSLTVTDRNGKPVEVTDNGDGTYTFTMPYGQVNVEAEFTKCSSLSFTDLDTGAWYHDYTDYVIAHGLMRGSGGLFDPDGTVTRAQMVTVLWNMRGKPVVNYYMTYSDVSEEAWYAEAVRWATSEGIAKGYGNGKFGPNDTISREQMAAMLYRYEQKYGSGGFTGTWMYRLPFTDLDQISDWAFEAVAWCNMRGVITGKGNGVFDPKGPAKRGELAAILTRYCGEDDTE